MELFLAGDDSEAELRAELAHLFPGVALRHARPLLFELPTSSPPGSQLPHVAFSRQWFPDAEAVNAESITAWVRHVCEAILSKLTDNQPWRLHVEPHYGARPVRRTGARAWHSARHRGDAQPRTHSGSPEGHFVEPGAGRQRCRLIREGVIELLRKRRRQCLRRLQEDASPFTPDTSCVQIILTSPESGFISIAPAPLPFAQRHLLSPFPKGEVVIPADHNAPSRAFAKLVESESRLGCTIQAGQTCVDLGASPGSWTYVALNRGARVVAVDRSPLRTDLATNPNVEFVPGDAFRFRPAQAVDWLLCDVIAPPDRSANLLSDWLGQKLCRHFVVTIKLTDREGLPVLESLKLKLTTLASDFRLTHLCSNKKEACAFGTR